jgi:hypothetical protein
VPPSFRKVALPGCVLHKSQLTTADVEIREGFALTTPLRTLCDLAVGPGITDEQYDRAIRDALRRGMARESVLKTELGKVMTPARRERFASLIG